MVNLSGLSARVFQHEFDHLQVFWLVQDLSYYTWCSLLQRLISACLRMNLKLLKSLLSKLLKSFLPCSKITPKHVFNHSNLISHVIMKIDFGCFKIILKMTNVILTILESLPIMALTVSTHILPHKLCFQQHCSSGILSVHDYVGLDPLIIVTKHLD